MSAYSSSPADERPTRHQPESVQVRLDRLDRMARGLDSQFRLPGTNVRFGWDSILGLVPGLGDLVTVGPALWMLKEAHQLGARKRVLARMGVNSALDLTLGGVPVLGDIFDVFFKANRRNLALLKAEMSNHTTTKEESYHA